MGCSTTPARLRICINLSHLSSRSRLSSLPRLVYSSSPPPLIIRCFLPGILALGAHAAPDHPNAKRDLKVAKQLMYTCYQMYARMATGIAPEYVNFPGGRDLEAAPNAAFYILRPETSESLFVLHQVTGNPICTSMNRGDGMH